MTPVRFGVHPRRHHFLVFIAPFFLFDAGCQDAPRDPAPAVSASPAKSAAAPPNPPPESSAPLPPRFTGELTVERVRSAKGSLPQPKPLREALGDLEAKLGAPTRTRRATTVGPERTWYEWAAANATTCATYSAVEQPNTNIEAAGEPEKGTTIACKLSAGESVPAKETEPITVTGVVADPREPVDVTVTELIDCRVKMGVP